MSVRGLTYLGRRIAKGTRFVQKRGNRFIWEVKSVGRDSILLKRVGIDYFLQNAYTKDLGSERTISREKFASWMDVNFLGWFEDFEAGWMQEDLREKRDEDHESALEVVAEIDAAIASGAIYNMVFSMHRDLLSMERQINSLSEDRSILTEMGHLSYFE